MSEAGYIPQPPVARVRQAVRERGAGATFTHLARWGTRYAAGLPLTLPPSGARRGETFTFQGRTYPYLHHRYKHSWLTERAVEVPVVRGVVDQHAAGRILEVGNVLSHYRPHAHLVVDKYEQAPGVLARDVLELEDLGRFELIVAISTLEHVGQDELPRDPDKAARATLALRELLAPGGRLVLTVPIGYNSAFDAALRDGTIPLADAAAMERIGDGRRWREAPPEDVFSARYDWLLYAARAVLFAFVDAAG